MKTIGLIFIFFAGPLFTGAQNPDIENWVTLLKDKSHSQSLSRFRIYQDIEKLDSADKIKAVTQLENACMGGNQRLKLLARSVKEKTLFYCLKVGDSLYASHMKICLNEAIKLDEPILRAEFGRWYAEMLNSLNQKELAVQYAISSIKLQEYLGLKHFPAVAQFYLWLGESLMLTDYLADAEVYLHNGLYLAKKDSLVRKENIMFTYNNLGIIHRRTKDHDSALYYFDKLQAISASIGRPDWVQIAHRNRMQSLVETGKLDSAEAEAKNLLQKSRAANNVADEMYAAEMLGNIACVRKDYTTALEHLLYSKKLNGGKNQRALSRVHDKLATCYEALNQPEKALHLLRALRRYNDSVNLEKVKYNSRFLAIKADYEKEQWAFRQLADEAQSAIRARNTGIAILAGLSFLGIFFLHKRHRKVQRLQHKAAEHLEQYKAEMISKNEQLEELITSLQKQQNRQMDTQRIEELSRQMILTDDDWQNFKQLFEQTYPSFFNQLKIQAPGITEAEQRMAALIRIQLNTKQIAAMQGISADSVHKTRQRLRLRFGTDSTTELENIIAAI